MDLIALADPIIAQGGGGTTGDVEAGLKSIALGVGAGLGTIGPGVGVGYIFGKVIESVTRQPEMRDEITSIQWLGLRADRGDRVLRVHLRPHRVLPLGRRDGAREHPDPRRLPKAAARKRAAPSSSSPASG